MLDRYSGHFFTIVSSCKITIAGFCYNFQVEVIAILNYYSTINASNLFIQFSHDFS